MRTIFVCLLVLLCLSCAESVKNSIPVTEVSIATIYNDSISIRAIDIVGNTLRYAGTNGVFGNIDLDTGKTMENVQRHDSIVPEFRAIGHTATDFFMLSVANPALLFKTGDAEMQLVYKEEGEGVFYDALNFWNNKEGIAVGDAVNGCFSIVITRDGGESWNKIPCSRLPEGLEGEGAFAASNTNIKIIGDKTWVATTKRILFSPDKGKTWEAKDSPIAHTEDTAGVYSIDFYDENIGIVFGGDYTDPLSNGNNKAITTDGGATWTTLAKGQKPGYRSCVQFVPNGKGKAIVAIGFKGIDYSSDMGASWSHLSDEPFYTLRFLNDTVAYAAGKHRIAKLSFR